MFGAIIGDVIGSAYEWHNVKSETFLLFTDRTGFTDDSVLTIATANAILHMLPDLSGHRSKRYNAKLYAHQYKLYGHRYPDSGFGEMFQAWCCAPEMFTQHSFGNGAAMRVSPIGWAFDTLEDVIRHATYSVAYTHRHPESKKGACAVASAVFLARTTKDKEEIKRYIQKKFHYDLSIPLSEIRPDYTFDSSCRGSVPQAIRAFLEGNDFVDTIRKAISIGGDSDTIAAIAGGIAEAYFQEIPKEIKDKTMLYLDAGLRKTIRTFYARFQMKL